jgi:hypothetical protein
MRCKKAKEMDIVSVDKKEPFKYAVANQKEIVADMSKAVVHKALSLVHSWVQSKMYYVVRYDAINNPDECKRFALKFAANPMLFLNGRRTGIEIDYSLISVCAGNWIQCDKLFGEELNYTVEYYISMLNGFPHTIFFRISNAEESYKEKIEYFINSLLGEDVKPISAPNVSSNIELIDVTSDGTDDDDDSQQICLVHPIKMPNSSTHHIIIYRGREIIVPKYITKTGLVVLGICVVAWVIA